MFKIKGYDSYVTKSFRLPGEVVDSLEFYATSKNISVNNLVLQMLEFCLEELESGEGDKPQVPKGNDRLEKDKECSK